MSVQTQPKNGFSQKQNHQKKKLRKHKLKQKQPRKRKTRHNKFNQKLTLVGTNCAGLNSKWQSLNKMIEDLKPAVFFGQETKLKKKQKFQISNSKYIVFRLEREKNRGRRTCHKCSRGPQTCASEGR